MSYVTLTHVLAAAVMNNESNVNKEFETAAEREPRAGKTSSSPTNSSHDQNSEVPIPSLRSVIRLPQAQKTYKSPSAVDVALNSSHNSSAAASDFTDQYSTAAVSFSRGNKCTCICTCGKKVEMSAVSLHQFANDLRLASSSFHLADHTA